MKKYTAKTLDDLLNNAAKEKGVTPSDLTYFITEEKKGILGIGTSVTAEVYCLNDVKEFIFNYLGTFFMEINHGMEIEIIQTDDTFKVMLNGENNAVLIGRGGQTLQAINTVLKAAVNNEFRRHFIVLVDINNYKEERYNKLKAMVRRVAKSVQRTKIDATLDPMPSDERKVIHQFLTEFSNIKTESEGTGRDRHLTIKYVPNEKA